MLILVSLLLSSNEKFTSKINVSDIRLEKSDIITPDELEVSNQDKINPSSLEIITVENQSEFDEALLKMREPTYNDLWIKMTKNAVYYINDTYTLQRNVTIQTGYDVTLKRNTRWHLFRTNGNSLDIKAVNGGELTLAGNNGAFGKTYSYLYCNTGRLTLSGNVILQNNSVQDSGGGINGNGGTINIERGVVIKNCSADLKGGGIGISDGCTLNLREGAVIRNCTAGDSGGGIFAPVGSPVYVYGTVTQCSVTGERRQSFDDVLWGVGGGVCANGKLVVSGATITYNSANQYGTSNTGCGGGIYTVNGGSGVSVSNSIVSNNFAGQGGGGLYINTRNLTAARISNTRFENNVAYSGRGGAIRSGNDMLISNNCIFFNNKAGTTGGAIYSSAKYTASDSIFNSNSSDDSGGALFISGDDTVVTGCTITSNKSGKNGGGIAVNSITSVVHTIIDSNRASYLGGGIYCAKNSITEITGAHCKIYSNSAYKGGGIYIDSKAILRISGGEIYKNTILPYNDSDVSLNGAGIYMKGGADRGTFELSKDGYVNENNPVFLGKDAFITVTQRLTSDSKKKTCIVTADNDRVLGRRIIKGTYSDATGSKMLYVLNDGDLLNQRFKLCFSSINSGTNANLRPGNYMSADSLKREKSDLTSKDIAISTKYSITYLPNPKDAQAAIPAYPKEKWWCENITLNLKAPTITDEKLRVFYTFKGWIKVNSDRDVTLKDSKYIIAMPYVYSGNENLMLKAVWAQYFSVAYCGNNQTKGENFIDSDKEISDIYTFADHLDKSGDEVFVRNEDEGKIKTSDSKSLEYSIQGWSLSDKAATNNNKYPIYKFLSDIEGRELYNKARQMDNFTVGETSWGEVTSPQNVYINLYAVWDQFPQIQAKDRWFNLSYVKSGNITSDVLFDTVKATDKEDGELTNKTDVVIYGTQIDEFKNFEHSGTATVTYKAKDSVGNITYKTVTIHIVNDTPEDVEQVSYVRFIDEKYYKKSEKQGGFNINSVWINNWQLRSEMEQCMTNKKRNVQKITYDLLGIDIYSHEIPGSGNWNRCEDTYIFEK